MTIKFNPRVLWRRSGVVGYVAIEIGDEPIDGATKFKLLAEAVAIAKDNWLTMHGPVIRIEQPRPRWCGAGAEREMIDNKLKTARDLVKVQLRKAGYTVR